MEKRVLKTLFSKEWQERNDAYTKKLEDYKAKYNKNRWWSYYTATPYISTFFINLMFYNTLYLSSPSISLFKLRTIPEKPTYLKINALIIKFNVLYSNKNCWVSSNS